MGCANSKSAGKKKKSRRNSQFEEAMTMSASRSSDPAVRKVIVQQAQQVTPQVQEIPEYDSSPVGYSQPLELPEYDGPPVDYSSNNEEVCEANTNRVPEVAEDFHIPTEQVVETEPVATSHVIADYVTAINIMHTNPIEAEQLIDRAYKEVSTDNPDHQMILPKLCKYKADLLREKGSTKDALKYYEEATASIENSNPDSIDMAECYQALATWGPEDKRLEREKKAVELYEKHLPGSTEHADTLVLYSMSLSREHNCAEALKCIIRALGMKRKADPKSVYLAIIIGHAADLYFHLGDYNNGWKYATEAKELFEKWGRAEKAELYDEISEMCEQQGRVKGESRCLGPVEN